MKMLTILVSKAMLHVSEQALTETKKEAEGCMATCRRLEISEKSAGDLVGSLEFVSAAIAKLTPGKGGEIKVEIPDTAVQAWRIAIGTWTRVQSKRDKGMVAKGLTTDFAKQSRAAQELINQLHDQLELDPVSIESFIPKKEEAGDDDGEEREALPDLGLNGEGSPADSRSRRGPKPAVSGKDRAAGEKDDDWDEGQPKATRTIAEKVRRERGK